VAKFRLIIWNVQDLLAVGAEGGARPQQGFDAKLAAPAAVVDAQQPDVLALQEVGEPEQLAALHQLFHTRHRFGRRQRGPPWSSSSKARAVVAMRREPTVFLRHRLVSSVLIVRS
jgi:hypothetical protein